MEEKYMNKDIQPTNENLNLSAAVEFTVTMLNFFKEVSNSKVKEVESTNQYNLDYYTEKKKYKLQKKEIKEKTKIEMKKIELKEKQIETMQNIINIAYKAYNKKIDFYQSQLQSCERFYNQQIIFFQNLLLEYKNKQDEAFFDTEKFFIIDNQIKNIQNQIDRINEMFQNIHSQLTIAIGQAKIEIPHDNYLLIE